MAELKYEIVEHIGVLSENARGWRKELNLIRDWAPEHAKMGKGVTLSADEAVELKNLLAGIDFDSFE